MSKFDEYFREPQYFSNGAYVLSGAITRNQAAELLAEYVDEEVNPESLESSRVRFGFPPDSVEGWQDGACWYTGATGKGSKPVWVYG